jgi:SAM-dependent methyltransferase
MRWQDIEGYFTFPDFYDYVAEQANAYVWWRGLEVGCYCGRSAAYLAERLNMGAKLDVLDCEMSKHGTRVNLRDFDRIGNLIEKDSVAAADAIENGSYDFVFIDADHSYASVRRDVDAWLPKVKPGGIIAGHDHCPDFTGVIQAVTETFPRYEVWRGMRGEGWGDKRMVDTGQYYSVWSVRV